MIIWSGFGWLAAVIALICTLAVQLFTQLITGSTAYYESNNWLLSISFLISGVICWFLGKYMHRPSGKTYTDNETGEQVEIVKKHTLFFIKIEYWAFIFAAIAIVSLFFKI